MSNNKTYIFLHIPKTGGSSLVSLIEMNYKQSEVFSNGRESYKIFGDDWKVVPFQERQAAVEKKFKSLSKAKRNAYKIVIGHMNYGWHEYLDNAAYTTYLREPVGRVISLYKYIARRDRMELSEKLRTEKTTLGDFVNNKMHWEIDNAMVKRIANVNEIPVGKEQEILALAKSRLQDFEYTGFTEHFNDSVVLMKKFMDFKHLYVEQRNASPKAQKGFITDEHRELTKSVNQLDLELYNSALSNFKNQVAAESSYIDANKHLLTERNLEYKLRRLNRTAKGYLNKIIK